MARVSSPPLEGRALAIADVLAWDEARSPFWGFPQVKARRGEWLERLSDDELRAEWRHYRALYGPPIR